MSFKWGLSDTIFALASGGLPSAVAIVRVSGNKVRSVIEKTVDGKFPQTRMLTYRKIKHSINGRPIDRGMCVYFQGPASYTGEDSCEFHIHGAKAVVSSLYSSLSCIEGVRLARPGEFTQRALFNGKLSLAQAEAVNDLIRSNGQVSHQIALNNLSGGLRNTVNTWQKSLLRLAALMEASIDFSDEHNFDVVEKYQDELVHIERSLISWIQRAESVSTWENGIKMSIIGCANVGKSTLMNALLKEKKSIVSDRAGTTRDIVEGIIEIGGEGILVADTAGINPLAFDEIEKEGIALTLERLRSSDIILYVRDIRDEAIDQIELDQNKINLLILNKADLLKADEINAAHERWRCQTVFREVIPLSAKNENDVEILRSKLSTILRQTFDCSSIDGLSVSSRHRSCVEDCLTNVRMAKAEKDLVMACEWVRQANRSLQLIDGDYKNFSEDILDSVFSQFCIGK